MILLIDILMFISKMAQELASFRVFHFANFWKIINIVRIFYLIDYISVLISCNAIYSINMYC